MFDLKGNWRCGSRKSQVCGLTGSRKKMCRVNLEEISILIWEWGKSERKTEESRKVVK